jgi:hypothetical protein
MPEVRAWIALVSGRDDVLVGRKETRHMHRVIPTLAISVALVLGTVAAATAQDDPMPIDEHPIVGSWTIDVGDGDPSLEFAVFTPGGIMFDASVDELAVGSWSPSGDRSIDFTFLARAPQPMTGAFTVRGSVEVAEDDLSFAGTYSFESSADLAETTGMPAGELGPGEVTGQRISVEPMGEPVGPMPDFAAPPPDAGASPSIEASPAP